MARHLSSFLGSALLASAAVFAAAGCIGPPFLAALDDAGADGSPPGIGRHDASSTDPIDAAVADTSSLDAPETDAPIDAGEPRDRQPPHDHDAGSATDSATDAGGDDALGDVAADAPNDNELADSSGEDVGHADAADPQDASPGDAADAADACAPVESRIAPGMPCQKYAPVSAPSYFMQAQQPTSDWGCLPESTPPECACDFTCACLKTHDACRLFPGFPSTPEWVSCDESTGLPTVTCK